MKKNDCTDGKAISVGAHNRKCICPVESSEPRVSCEICSYYIEVILSRNVADYTGLAVSLYLTCLNHNNTVGYKL
jgi:hypothetical protein